MWYFLLKDHIPIYNSLSLSYKFQKSDAPIIGRGWDVSRSYWTKRSFQLHKVTMELVCNGLSTFF